MSASVRTPWGDDEVADGMDYAIDEDDGALAILDGPREDDTSDTIAHYKPEHWYRVRIDGGAA